MLRAAASLLRLPQRVPVAAAASRGLAGPPPTSEAGTLSTGNASSASATDPLITHIQREHSHLEDMFREYEANPPGATRMRLAWEIIRGLSVHAAKEEMTLYPSVAKHMGNAAADHLVEEHQQLKEVLYQIDGVTEPSPDLDELVAKTIEVTRAHVKQEEGEFLPKLAQRIGPEGMQQLASAFEAARIAAPTRPHPNAPNRPPLNYAANASAVPLDLARDAVRFGPGHVAGDVQDHKA